MNSYFDGKLRQIILLMIIGGLVTTLTFGLAYPWVVCRFYAWEASHTVINGRRLRFNGRAMSLFGQWIKWLFLTFITFGIYGFWLRIKLKQWKIKNTEFV